jgi:hypothetical protein
MTRRCQFESQYVYTDNYIVSLNVNCYTYYFFHCKLHRDLFVYYNFYNYYTSKRVHAHTQFINVNLFPVLCFCFR